jgi:hypothetical protein
MEKLIILLLFGLGTAISSYLQNRKKREEEARDAALGKPTPTARTGSGEPPVPHWPKTSQDWQKELRRVLEERMNPRSELPPPLPQTRNTPTAPPSPARPRTVIQTKVLPPAGPAQTVLQRSTTIHARAAQLPANVAERMTAIEQQTQHARPAPVPARHTSSPAATVVARWTRHRPSLREAFVASLIFSPPIGLQSHQSPFETAAH